MNKIERKKIKNSVNRKVIFFTFLGAFILFFTVFTYVIPMIMPNVDEPALTDEYAMDSVTSQDFRGRIDPRLQSIENQEDAPQEEAVTVDNNADSDNELSDTSTQTEDENTDESNQGMTSDSSDQQKINQMENKITQNQDNALKKQEIAVNMPPKPRSIELRSKMRVGAPVPVYKAKVVVGDFTNPKEVQIASDVLYSLNYQPVVVTRDGKYSVVVGTYSDSQDALDAVNDLKSRNFDARIVYD